jgi:HlyD family secretion protein
MDAGGGNFSAIALRPRKRITALVSKARQAKFKRAVMKSVRKFSTFVLLAAGALALAGCHRPPQNRVQGYTEGEYLYMASPLGGAVKTLDVERGDQVKKGGRLFTLDDVSEQANLDEVERKLKEAEANLADAKKGERPTEIAQIEAQLKKAHSALQLSVENFNRMQKLFQSGTAAREDFDATKSQRDQDQHAVGQLEAQLKTAELGSREDQINAAEEAMKAQEAAVRGAQWSVEQKAQFAPKDALVYDTLFRPGEFVAAGQPVVMLLPPENMKVRAFVPEQLVGTLQPGDQVKVQVDGVAEPFAGTIRYISPQVEYAPPVIYSREVRSKFVTMIEIRFSEADARKLHPGQPVDVDLPPAK